MSLRVRHSFVSLALGLAYLLTALNSSAARREWTGAVNQLWSTPGNWRPVGAPTTGDDLVLTPAYDARLINDLPEHTSIRSVSCSGRLHATGAAVSVGSGGFNAVGGFELFWSIPIAVTSPQTWRIDEYARVSVTGTVELGASDVSIILGKFGSVVFNRAVSGSGNIVAAGPGHVRFSGAEHGLNTATGALLIHDTTVTLGNPYPGNIHLIDRRGVLILENGTFGGYLTATAGTIYTPSSFQPVRFGGLTLAPGVKYVELISDDVQIGYGKAFVDGPVHLNQAVLDVATQTRYRRGTEFVIIDNDGVDPVHGTFKGLPEGALFAPTGWPRPTGQTFRISYSGGTGNDVVLVASHTDTDIPTTGDIALVLLFVSTGVIGVLRLRPSRIAQGRDLGWP